MKDQTAPEHPGVTPGLLARTGMAAASVRAAMVRPCTAQGPCARSNCAAASPVIHGLPANVTALSLRAQVGWQGAYGGPDARCIGEFWSRY
jgi:hypothetical protein